ncbi:hypothetical protein [Microcoleus vaginatus]|uniref:hypothetical protein n=1 Tax=Microcoleus vaginatus TaxID=119532 RepID=UPI00403F8C17
MTLVVTPSAERDQSTFDKIQIPPKTLITVTGANHFGISDVNNPAGANPDLNTATLEPAVGIETIARWSALFLRANMLKDRAAFDYIYSQGDGLDPKGQCHQRGSSTNIFSGRIGEVWYCRTWLSLEKTESYYGE